MKERIEKVLNKLDELDLKIDKVQTKLSGIIEPYEAREIVAKELNTLMLIKYLCNEELIEAIEVVELKLQNL